MEQPAKPSFFRKWSIMFVLSSALAIIIIDTTLLNVALGTIIKDLSTDLTSIQWVITAYALMLAALTITGGRLGDLFGRKKMFMLGAVIFAAGSLTASLSHHISTMIIGESIVEGIGAALMMPATASLLVTHYRGRDRGIAFGLWGGVAAASSAIGPILGGYLTTHYSWRWGFRINVFVAALLLLGSILIKESRDREEKPSLDWIGVLLSASGLLAVVFGIIESAQYGWWRAKALFTIGGLTLNLGSFSITPVAIALGLVLLVLFVAWERHVVRRGQTPLVNMRLFANRQFSSGVVTLAAVSLGQFGMIFALPIYLQAVGGLDAFHTGLALLPLSLAILVAAPFSGFIGHKVAPKKLIQLGLAINVLALFVIRNAITISVSTSALIPGLVIYGIGMGLVMAQINNLVLSAVSVQEAGEASGVNNTFRQVGSSFGSAIIGAVVISILISHFTSGVQASSKLPAPVKAPLIAAVSANGSKFEFAAPPEATNIPPAVAGEIDSIRKQATIDGNRLAMYYAAGFAVLALLVSFALPGSTHIETGESAAGKGAA